MAPSLTFDTAIIDLTNHLMSVVVDTVTRAC